MIFSDYNSADTISDRLHRLNRIRETNSGGTILTQYSYNGVERNVITDYQPPDVHLILYFGVSGSYHGLDRFGRIVDHMWDGYSGKFDVARGQHWVQNYFQNGSGRLNPFLHRFCIILTALSE